MLWDEERKHEILQATPVVPPYTEGHEAFRMTIRLILICEAVDLVNGKEQVLRNYTLGYQFQREKLRNEGS